MLVVFLKINIHISKDLACMASVLWGCGTPEANDDDDILEHGHVIIKEMNLKMKHANSHRTLQNPQVYTKRFSI